MGRALVAAASCSGVSGRLKVEEAAGGGGFPFFGGGGGFPFFGKFFFTENDFLSAQHPSVSSPVYSLLEQKFPNEIHFL